MNSKSFIKKFHYNSPVILTFAFLSLFTFLLGYLTNGYSTSLLFSVYRGNAISLFFWIRLVGHILGHASFEHFFNNFIIILLIGPMLEEKYGSQNMAVMILFTAIITGLLHIIFFNTALLGASGIAFMLILLSSFVNFQKGKIPITLLFVVVAYLGREVLAGIYANDNISQITHIVGGICGGIFGYFLNRRNGYLRN